MQEVYGMNLALIPGSCICPKAALTAGILTLTRQEAGHEHAFPKRRAKP